MRACVRARVRACVYVCMYVLCMYVCMYVCMERDGRAYMHDVVNVMKMHER